EGVDLSYRRTTVFCPWPVFRISARPPRWKRFAVVLRVDPRAANNITAARGGRMVRQGLDVRTRQLQFLSDQEIMLRSLYQVDIRECCELLLRLGFLLTEGPARATRTIP